MNDAVNAPSHYRQGEVECIQAIKSALGDEGFEAYCVGACIKYLWRYRHKGKPLEDVRKASYYLDRVVELLESRGVNEGCSDN